MARQSKSPESSFLFLPESKRTQRRNSDLLGIGSNARRSKRVPYPFVLDALEVRQPETRVMFGFAYVYVGQQLVCLLRERENQPHFNGFWLATESQHLRSLQPLFPSLPSQCFVNSGKNGWVFVPVAEPEFEPYVSLACDLIVRSDPRVGSGSKRSWVQRWDMETSE
jgi:hypothetical protein